jgi:hypothetical protein
MLILRADHSITCFRINEWGERTTLALHVFGRVGLSAATLLPVFTGNISKAARGISNGFFTAGAITSHTSTACLIRRVQIIFETVSKCGATIGLIVPSAIIRRPPRIMPVISTLAIEASACFFTLLPFSRAGVD